MRYLRCEAVRIDDARLIAALGQEPHTPLDQKVEAKKAAACAWWLSATCRDHGAKRAEALGQDDGSVNMWLGITYYLSGDFERARATCLRAGEVNGPWCLAMIDDKLKLPD